MTRDEAIAVIEEHRQTHAAWVEYLREGGCEAEADPQGPVGGVEHHEACMRKYDGVLEVLRGHDD